MRKDIKRQQIQEQDLWEGIYEWKRFCQKTIHPARNINGWYNDDCGGGGGDFDCNNDDDDTNNKSGDDDDEYNHFTFT